MSLRHHRVSGFAGDKVSQKRPSFVSLLAPLSHRVNRWTSFQSTRHPSHYPTCHPTVENASETRLTMLNCHTRKMRYCPVIKSTGQRSFLGYEQSSTTIPPNVRFVWKTIMSFLRQPGLVWGYFLVTN